MNSFTFTCALKLYMYCKCEQYKMHINYIQYTTIHFNCHEYTDKRLSVVSIYNTKAQSFTQSCFYTHLAKYGVVHVHVKLCNT